MWKQSSGDRRVGQLSKRGGGSSVGWQRRGLHLFQLWPRWIHVANRWICYPVSPQKKKKKTEPKQVSLLSHWRLWSTAHLLLQSKPVDPSARMELHLYKHSEGGMCEQCHKRILFSKRGVDLANEWFMWLRIWVWWSDVKLGKWSLFCNVNTNGVTWVFVFTDVM